VPELLVRVGFVPLQERRETLQCRPAVEGVAKVVGTAQIAEPEAALRGELPQKWAPV
jgi:hypothetical protein